MKKESPTEFRSKLEKMNSLLNNNIKEFLLFIILTLHEELNQNSHDNNININMNSSNNNTNYNLEQAYKIF